MKIISMCLGGALLAIASLHPAAQQPDEGGLSTFYKNMIADFSNGHPPKLETVTNYLDKIPGMDVNEIQSALPWIQKAVESPNEEVSSYGVLGLYAIDQRQDSASLIGNLAPVLARKLDDPYICALSIMTLSSMKPKPPEAAISDLLLALRTDSELQFYPEIGPGIVFALVQIDPNRDDIAGAIDDYMHSKMKTTAQKVDTLNALAGRQVLDARLIANMAAHLTEKSEDVRLSAIRALIKSGAPAIATSRTQLEQMAGPGEPSDTVRAAARQALESAGEFKDK